MVEIKLHDNRPLAINNTNAIPLLQSTILLFGGNHAPIKDIHASKAELIPPSARIPKADQAQILKYQLNLKSGRRHAICAR